MADTPAQSLRIVYFTTLPAVMANGIIGLIQSLGHKVVLVVVTPGTKARPNENYKDVAANIIPGTDVLVTSHMKRLAGILRGLEPDLIFVTGFSRLLPDDVLAVPRLGAINTHPAPLPRYRGPDPIYWQLKNGETEIGMTIHRMLGEFDTGPILAQGTIPIDVEASNADANMRLLPLGAKLLPEAFAAVLAGDPGTPQNEAEASYAPLRDPAERLLDWSKPALQLRNLVRAWGDVGALAEIDGKDYLVLRATALPDDAASGGAPGSVVASDPATVVQTGDGLLRLDELTLVPEEI